jgi:transcription antitermination factor NusG
MGLRMAELYAQESTQSRFASADGQEWYGIQVIPRHERTVTAALDGKRLATFLPLVTELHNWSDRRQKVEMPLFAGYTFVRFTPSTHERVVVLGTRGVVRLVGKEYVGTPIPSKQIGDIWTLVYTRLNIEPHPFLNVGDRVRIRSGSLTGVEGILTDKNSDATLVVSVDILQRSVAVHIDGFHIERIGSGQVRAA